MAKRSRIQRVPTWWVDLGADRAQRLERLFADVMADLPMTQDELAKKVGKDQSSVARWATGRMPRPKTMLKAVKVVREYAEQLRADAERIAKRATVAEQALRRLVTASGAETGTRAHRDNVEVLERLLDDLGD